MSDYYFADISMFLSYMPFKNLSEELSANKGLVFSIIGKGDVKFQMYINGRIRNVILKDILHTPGLRYNLISVSKLEKKSTSMIFKDGKAIVKLADGLRILSAIKSRRIYIVELDKMLSKTFIA